MPGPSRRPQRTRGGGNCRPGCLHFAVRGPFQDPAANVQPAANARHAPALSSPRGTPLGGRRRSLLHGGPARRRLLHFFHYLYLPIPQELPSANRTCPRQAFVDHDAHGSLDALQELSLPGTAQELLPPGTPPRLPKPSTPRKPR